MVSPFYNILKLHLAQAEFALEKAKNNTYSDKRKEEYQDKLSLLFCEIKKSVANDDTISEAEIYDQYKRHIDFIFKSLEFLDSSTLNQIPYEIVECLDYAMKDWLTSGNEYVIVTSLINNVGGFSFDPTLAYSETIYNEIKTKYSIEFNCRLVQINLPRALVRDYLSSVVLYHELGHFIDMKFKFTESLTREILDNVTGINTIDTVEVDRLLYYFPYLTQFRGINTQLSTTNQYFWATANHLGEFFCDLFASQYISDSSNFYLQYLTEDNRNYTGSHPSTNFRVNVVNDFLNKIDNILVNRINKAIASINGMALEIRSEEVLMDDFFNLLPANVANLKQLHGLFNTGWKIWLNEQSRLSKSLNDQYTAPVRLHNVINNLIEKSIANFITQLRWEKAKPKE
jgi:hypothetical protein